MKGRIGRCVLFLCFFGISYRTHRSEKHYFIGLVGIGCVIQVIIEKYSKKSLQFCNAKGKQTHLQATLDMLIQTNLKK